MKLVPKGRTYRTLDRLLNRLISLAEPWYHGGVAGLTATVELLRPGARITLCVVSHVRTGFLLGSSGFLLPEPLRKALMGRVWDLS